LPRKLILVGFAFEIRNRIHCKGIYMDTIYCFVIQKEYPAVPCIVRASNQTIDLQLFYFLPLDVLVDDPDGIGYPCFRIPRFIVYFVIRMFRQFPITNQFAVFEYFYILQRHGAHIHTHKVRMMKRTKKEIKQTGAERFRNGGFLLHIIDGQSDAGVWYIQVKSYFHPLIITRTW